MPGIIFPLRGPIIAGGSGNSETPYGSPVIAKGFLPLPAQDPPLPPVLPQMQKPRLFFRGAGFLNAHHPWGIVSAPYLDPNPNPVAGLPFPVQFVTNISRRFGAIAVRPQPQRSPVQLVISGTTRDSVGNALGGCAVHLFRTVGDVFIDLLTSDATTGAFSFTTPGPAQNYFVVSYLPGSPDRAGTSLNTLVGT